MVSSELKKYNPVELGIIPSLVFGAIAGFTSGDVRVGVATFLLLDVIIAGTYMFYVASLEAQGR